MVSPLGLIARAVRPARLTQPIGRCPVCHELIDDRASALTLRGGVHVHRSCATYRIRQRARADLSTTAR
jgi:hypothetical protein